MSNSNVVIERTYSAGLDELWSLWTTQRGFESWWGPKGFTAPVCEFDARLGGRFRIHMRAPDGVVHPMTGRFLEIDRPHRLVFETAAIDGGGSPMFEVLNTVTFTGVNGGTEISLIARVTSTTPSAPRYLSGMSQGWPR